MKVKKVLKTIIFKTCKVNEEIVDGSDYGGSDITWKAAYSLIDGSYIGDAKSADYYERKGIIPQLRHPDHNTASIGFCKKEQKWYGWSHRALHGFGIGSKVKKGDCAYSPIDPQDLLDEMISFWADDEDEFVTKDIVLRKELGVEDPEKFRKGLGALVEVERIRKKDKKVLNSVHWSPYLDVWGKGNWKAKTLEDAKEMAIDFARSVS